MKDKPVILVVDDQPKNIELFEAYLVPQGYEIVKAASGEEALGKLSGNQIDLILLDILMPGMNGFEVTRRVRGDDKNRLLPIILVTVLRDTEDRVKGIEAGCDDFITMPDDKMELLPRVRSLLKVKAYNDLMSNYKKELESEITRRTEELKCTLETLQQYIAERKQAEEALKESEKKYRLLADNVNDVIFALDMNLNYTYVSPSVKILRGYEPAEVLKQPSNETLTPSSMDLAMRNLSEIMELEKSRRRDINTSRTLQLEMVRKDGTTVWTEVKFSFMRDENQRLVGILGVTRDITERKQAEGALIKSEARYRGLFENAQEGIFQTTYEGQYLAANRALATILGYDSPEDLMTTVIDIPKQLYVNPEDRKVLLQMIEEQGSVRGFETQFYRKNGSIIWVSVNQHAVRDAGGRLLYYEGFNEDITIKRESIERMRKALGATVQAMAVTVETRDPYTAGHQRRVADLARAIATEMNLPSDQIDGIRMAAIIHDLGKISVPAEILSKPSKLTDLEFGIIKTHAQSGYNILKDIEFPWPIARMVLEHHERMNGSGYPNGLTGDNSLLESRILAVADVVESMASHRPYRPSLGIEAALEEIEKNRGTLYDAGAVEACLRLCREKGFQLP